MERLAQYIKQTKNGLYVVVTLASSFEQCVSENLPK